MRIKRSTTILTWPPK